MSKKLIKLKFLNQVDAILETELTILKQLEKHYTFKIKDFEKKRLFIKKYRFWDGKVSLIRNLKSGVFFPMGLVPDLMKTYSHGYDIALDDEIKKSMLNDISEDSFDDWLETINLPEKYSLRTYQYETAFKAIRNKRLTVISPTASGKSLLLWIYAKYYLDHNVGKILLVVPRISLVEQMEKDFISYGCTDEIHKITAGCAKDTNKKITVSTWQSIYYDSEDYFNQFGCLIIDECHSIHTEKDGTSMVGLIKKAKKADYRLAVTGTLDDSCVLTMMQIEAVIGRVYESITMQELTAANQVTPAIIHSVQIEFPANVANTINSLDYNEQVKFIELTGESVNPLNYLMIEMAVNMVGNTLLLFNFIESGHGPFLYQKIMQYDTIHDDNIFYIDGQKSLDDRKKVVTTFEEKNNCIAICSMGTFSTGINIKNLNNLFICSSTKSLYRTKQSVGRVLRLCAGKESAHIYDFSANTKYSLKHYAERKGYYKSDGHTVKESIIPLENVIRKLKEKGYEL